MSANRLTAARCSVGVLLLLAGRAFGEPDEPTPAPPEFDAPPLLAPEGEAEADAAEPDEEVPILGGGVGAEEVLPVPAVAPIAPVAPIVASAGPVTREQHPWARHQPGSWRRLRIVSESFDDQGLLVGRSETFRRETLVESSEAGYSLRVETTVDFGGRRIPGQTQQLSFGLTAESKAAVPTIVEDAPSSISLAGRAVPCETWVWTTTTDRGEAQHTLYYSPEFAPHVLKRERADLVDGRSVGEEVFRVVRLGAPIEYAGAIIETHHSVKERASNGGGATREFTVHSERVPGGVLTKGVTETDVAGRRVRWTITRLVEHGTRGQTRREGTVVTAPPEVFPGDVRPRRWMRLMRRGGVRLSDDDLDDLEDELEDLQDELEDLYDD